MSITITMVVAPIVAPFSEAGMLNVFSAFFAAFVKIELYASALVSHSS